MRPRVSTLAPLQALGFVRSNPHPKLRPFVNSYWQIKAQLSSPRQEYLHPDGSLGLVFNWGDTQWLSSGGSYASGASFDTVSKYSLSLKLEGILNCFGVLLKPGVAYTLFRIPAWEIGVGDTLNSGLRRHLVRITEQLSEAKSFLERVAVVETWLGKVIAAGNAEFGPARAAIQMLQQAPGELDIVSLCGQMNLSRRHMERLLKRDLGLTYKEYQNLLRVRVARNAIKRRSPHSLAEIALAAGFYDQAHFNRAFTASMGITPGQYRHLVTTRQKL
ncbi:helix-turn-helix protein [Alteromonadaceae bacterium 2753L.S.0a.02]|nr:helix-turn-helix protein [Alteromonadaceae bacterium 2753L.S.0a.02]